MKSIKYIIVFSIVSLFHTSWAKSDLSIKLLPGLYKSSGCDLFIKIKENDTNFLYQLISNNLKSANILEDDKKFRNNTEGKITLEGEEILFNDLYSTFYGDNNYGKKAFLVGGSIENNRSFIIQNYGNSMNPYLVFGTCSDKLLTYEKIVTISLVKKKTYLFKSLNKPTKMYLIKGDKVTLLDEKTDDSNQKWYFINYKGKKDLNMWIKAEAVDLEPKAETNQKQEKEEPKPIEKATPKEPEPATQIKAEPPKPTEVSKQAPETTPPKNTEIIQTKPIKTAKGSISLALLSTLLGLLAWRLS